MAQLIKVAGDSHTTRVAGAIAGIMREDHYVEMRAMGANAVNQMIKSVIIARGYLEQDDIDLMVVPRFEEIIAEGGERTAVHFSIFERK